MQLIRTIGCGLALATLLTCTTARAESPWRLTSYLSTSVPTEVALRATVETPYRFRLTTSVGLLPEPYLALSNAILVGAEAYNQATADLIEAALGYGLVWKLRAGWRPFAKLGLYVELGYMLATLGGGASGQEIIAGASGQPPPASGGGRQYDLAATTHLIDLEIGWRFDLFKQRLWLLVAVGYSGVLGATATVTPDFASSSPRLTAAFANASAAYLVDVLTTYVHTPTVTVAIGYRLF